MAIHRDHGSVSAVSERIFWDWNVAKHGISNMGAVEALYIFDEHNNPILEHVYSGRPPSAAVLLPLYLDVPSPRSSLIHLPNTIPQTILFSMVQDRLLFLCPTSTDTEPLLILEFLHRVADVLEDFLGSPLLAAKIESSYDVVAQILGEMCDAGTVCNTEPNALKEVVEMPNWVGNLLGGFGLPAVSPALSSRTPTSIQRPNMALGSGVTSVTTSSAGSAIPWRRSNVRHTSNELYVDIVETLSVILAPSGRPLSAFANGTIAFTSKISGVPDLQLTLTAPGGTAGIKNAMDLPCFHPCVRLARWRDHPGQLSFVPPDGRFVLAGYECDLVPDMFMSAGQLPTPNLPLPASLELRPSLGINGDEFEVRLSVSRTLSSSKTSANPVSTVGGRPNNSTGRFATVPPASGISNNTDPSGGAAIANVVVAIPIPAAVRNVSNLRCSKGEAHILHTEAIVEWRIPNKDVSSIGSAGATLRCTFVGPPDESEDVEDGVTDPSRKTATFDYDGGSYQVDSTDDARSVQQRQQVSVSGDTRRISQNASLMPRSASLSFSANGWLASGIKVDSLTVNTKNSTGLGQRVTPYKGVKYHTVSQQGIEARC